MPSGSIENALLLLYPNYTPGESDLTYWFATTVPSYAQGKQFPYSLTAGGPTPYTFQNGHFVSIASFDNIAFASRLLAGMDQVSSLYFEQGSNENADIVVFGTNQILYQGNDPALGFAVSPTESGGIRQDIIFTPAGVSDYQVTFAHEVMHSVGIRDINGILPGGPGGEDNARYTIMSYNPHPENGRFAVDPQLYDVAALQALWGSGTAGLGDSVISDFVEPPSSPDAGKDRMFAIWDGSGTDTIDASSLGKPVLIDLRPGYFSSIGPESTVDITAGTNPAVINDGPMNISIAFGTYIENAKGTGDGDLIIGNLLSNKLEGGAGDDVIYGEGIDSIHDASDAEANYRQITTTGTHIAPAPDSIKAFIDDKTRQMDHLLGGAGDDHLRGGRGSDIIEGGDDNDILIGGAGDDTLVGERGSDTLDGGDGTDRAIYSAPNGPKILSTSGTGASAVVTIDDGEGGTDTLRSIETIVGPAGTMDVLQMQNAGGIRIDGDAGAALVRAVATFGFEEFEKVELSDAADIVFGGTKPIHYVGGGGVNYLEGSGAGTKLESTTGDTYFLARSGATVVSGAGNDYIEAEGAAPVTIVFGRGSGHDVLGSHFGSRPVAPNDPTWWYKNPSWNESYGVDFWVDQRKNDTIKLDGLSPSDVELVWDWYYPFREGPDDKADAQWDQYGNAAIRIKDTGETLYLGFIGVKFARGSFGNSDLLMLESGRADWSLPSQEAWQVDLNIFEFADGQRYSLLQMFDLVNVPSVPLGLLYSAALDLPSQVMAAAHDTIRTSAGGDYVEGSAANDDVFGGDGGDYIDTGAGDDFVRAGRSHDWVVGGPGNDNLDGGSGIDFIDYSAALESVVVDLEAGTASGASTGTDKLFAFEDVRTGAGADDVRGTDAANYIDGGAGDDILDARGGDDNLRGAGGNDTQNGGDGNDTFLIGPGDGFDAIFGGEGYDTIAATADGTVLGFSLVNHVETISANGFSDVSIRTTDADESWDFYWNTMIGIAEIDVGGGNDRLVGHSLTTLLRGGDGNDEIYSQEGNDALFGDAGDDYLSSWFGDDTLNGGSGADRLEGGDGADTLDGGLGVDTLDGGAGWDTYLWRPGDGSDLLIDQGATTTHAENRLIIEGASLSDFTVKRHPQTLDGALTLIATGETILIPDLFAGTGAGVAEVEFRASAGSSGTVYYLADLAQLAVDDDQVGSITGTVGSDTLTGTSLDDRLYGLAGADILAGNQGNDLLDGGSGQDRTEGGPGDDIHIVDDLLDIAAEDEGAGIDTVHASVTWTLAANIEQLTLTGTAAIDGTGNALANSLTGNSAANTLNGLAGADTMVGNAGDDIYIVDDAGDLAVEASATGGVDAVHSSVSFTLGANVENLTLTGSAAIDGTGNALANIVKGNGASNVLKGGSANDKILGNAGSDRVYGGNGNDQVDGGSGPDQVYGNLGNDELTGGYGTDEFRFDSALDEAANVDRILDFTVADDTIFLGRSIFAAAGPNGTLTASAFHAGTAAADADDRIIYDSATGKIFYDADGSGAVAGVLFAQIEAGTALTNADFVIYG